MTENDKCVVCRIELIRPKERDHFDREFFYCRNCGKYMISTRAYYLPALRDNSDDYIFVKQRAILSHAICKMHKNADIPDLGHDLVNRILEEGNLPTPVEQAANAILWLGQELEYQGHGSYVKLIQPVQRALIGAMDADGVTFIIKSLEKQELLRNLNGNLQLTFEGWERYEELKRSVKDSRKAFMAMSFRHEDIAEFYEQFFKQAVQETGFTLQKLDEEPEAGLIDVRMEVEIRNSRFVVADLTHGNQGVYWESGFAYGLDKHVIYTCKEGCEDQIHFDTKHRRYVKWNPETPDQAVRDLKATIRATLPTEAKMEDEVALSS